MNDGQKLITWFEIPVTDVQASMIFYSQVLGVDLEYLEMDEKKFGIFPSDATMTGGAIVEAQGYNPSPDGKSIFFEAAGVMDAILDRVVPSGGEVFMPKKWINDEIGDIAIFSDLDGNRVGLHSH